MSRRQRKRDMQTLNKSTEEKQEPITYNIQPHDVNIKITWELGFKHSTED